MDAPLEILSSQRPGQNPVQIQQRPFHTRIKINKTQLPAPPFATGIPLPELLIPGKTFALISFIFILTTGISHLISPKKLAAG